MASAIVPTEKPSLSASDELKQCICGKPMEEPRLLDCLHVIGLCCIEAKGKTKEALECTLCEVKTQVPGRDKTLLPEPRFLQVLAMAERKKQGQRPLCEQCGTSSHEASGHCQQCAEYVCEKAAETHKKLKFMKGHNIVPLTKFESTSAPSFESLCRAHDQLHTAFCTQCKQALCSECRYSKHDGHNNIGDLNFKINWVNKSLDASRKELASKTTPLQTRLIEPVPDGLGDVQKAAAEIANKIAFLRSYLLLRTQQILEAGSKEERIMLSQLLEKTRGGTPRITKDLSEGKLVYVPKGSEFVVCKNTDRFDCLERAKYMKNGDMVTLTRSPGVHKVLYRTNAGEIAVQDFNAPYKRSAHEVDCIRLVNPYVLDDDN